MAVLPVLRCQSVCKQATWMFCCYGPLQSMGLPTCSHSSSVLLAQCGPLGERPAGSLIGPREPAIHSGGLWPRAFKRGVPLGPMCSRRLRAEGFTWACSSLQALGCFRPEPLGGAVQTLILSLRERIGLAEWRLSPIKVGASQL